jgi:hypothetical protein
MEDSKYNTEYTLTIQEKHGLKQSTLIHINANSFDEARAKAKVLLGLPLKIKELQYGIKKGII